MTDPREPFIISQVSLGAATPHSPHCRRWLAHGYDDKAGRCSAHCLGALARREEETTEGGGHILSEPFQAAADHLAQAAVFLSADGKVPAAIADLHSRLLGLWP